MPNLVLLAGVPGSGKTTWARSFFDLKYATISSDDVRRRVAGSLKGAHREGVKPWDIFYEEVEYHLCHSVDVIADATFLTRRHRDRARAIADKTGADLHLVLFKNIAQAQVRNSKRAEDEHVPDKVLADMIDLYWDTLAEIAQERYSTVTKIESFG